MIKAVAWAQARQNQEEGQTFIEYALVIALVSVVLGVALLGFGQDIIAFAQTTVTDAIGGGGS